jgi:hypothetical protein
MLQKPDPTIAMRRIIRARLGSWTELGGYTKAPNPDENDNIPAITNEPIRLLAT